jgi:hypothetical protein
MQMVYSRVPNFNLYLIDVIFQNGDIGLVVLLNTLSPVYIANFLVYIHDKIVTNYLHKNYNWSTGCVYADDMYIILPHFFPLAYTSFLEQNQTH